VVDPSGKISLIEVSFAEDIGETLRGSSVNLGTKKALDIAKNAKIFSVYDYVQLPLHFYMYVERKNSHSGIRYDVGAPGGWGNLGRELCRGNLCGRMPGFVRSERASRYELKGKRKKIASFSLGQYILWHTSVMGTEQMECSIDITYSLAPGPNCLSWTFTATLKAIAISKLKL